MLSLKSLAETLREPGPWCTIHAEVSTGTVATHEATEVLANNVSRAVTEAGGSDSDARAAEQLEWAAIGEPGPVSRFGLIRNGQVVVNELLPGAPGRPVVDIGPIPDLLPLAEVPNTRESM